MSLVSESPEKSESDLPMDDEVLDRAPNKDLVFFCFNHEQSKTKLILNIYICSGDLYHRSEKPS